MISDFCLQVLISFIKAHYKPRKIYGDHFSAVVGNMETTRQREYPKTCSLALSFSQPALCARMHGICCCILRLGRKTYRKGQYTDVVRYAFDISLDVSELVYVA